MEEFVLNINNKQVFGNKWLVQKGAKGNILILHGMLEYSARYDDFARFLNENGFNVYALDHKGHGLNVKNGTDEYGIWNERTSFEECVDRVKAEFDYVSQNGLVTYIFSHSMGSFMGQRFIEKYPETASKIVLCGTSGKQGAFGFGKFVTRIHCFLKKKNKKSPFLNKLFFMGYNSHFKKENCPVAWLSVNDDNKATYIQDPMCGGVPSRGFFLSFVEGLTRIFSKREFKKISPKTKILLIAGDEDPVGGYGKYVRKLQNAYTGRNISSKMILYPGLRHEILNEKDHLRIYEDVLKFLQNE